MRKRWLLLWLVLCMLCCAGAVAEPIYPAREALETDAGVFQLACDAAGFAVPHGYRLEGFRRADFNGDARVDIVASLRHNDGPQRYLVLLLSADTLYEATLCPAALPDVDTGGLLGDPLAGIAATPDGITLYTHSGSDWHCMASYYFVLYEGAFHLSALSVLRWHDFLPEGTYEIFNYDQGRYTSSVATMDGRDYSVGGITVQRPFAVGRGPRLDDFNCAAFPTAYDDLLFSLAFPAATPTPEATDAPTHRATQRPQNTASPTAEAMTRCESCGLWMTTADFAAHTCNQPPVQCPQCGQWFASADFATHHCALAVVQCPQCGNWYEEGTVFRNHICNPS